VLLQFYVSSGLEQGDRTAFLFGFPPSSVPLALACSKLPSAEELVSVAGVQTDRTCLCKWQAPRLNACALMQAHALCLVLQQ